MRIIFMGGGTFGEEPLLAIQQKHTVIAVYTYKEHNKGSRFERLNSSIKHCENIRTPKKLDDNEIDYLRKLEPDLIVVASYGLMIPKAVLELTKYPVLNIHPSLLPRWRGAAPIARALEAGDSITGVSIMKVTPALDAGDVLLQKPIIIQDSYDITTLTEICSKLGAEMIIKAIDNIDHLLLHATQQNEDEVTYAHKISAQDRYLDFNNTKRSIYKKISALGGCYFKLQDITIKIISAEIDNQSLCVDHKPGYIDIQNNLIACQDGYISPIKMQRNAKKIMPAKEFWKGVRL